MSREFQETRWSIIGELASENSAVASNAWEEVYRLYQKPIIRFIILSGWKNSDAEDLMQSFFSKVAEKKWLEEADPLRGKLRSFLLGRLKNHLRDARKYEMAEKRGGLVNFVRESSESESGPIDSDEAASAAFDQEWAVEIYQQSMKSLEEDCQKKSQLPILNIMKKSLSGELNDGVSKSAQELGMNASALHVALHRLRQSLSSKIRLEVSETLLPGEDIETELRYLGKVLGSRRIESL